MGDVRLVFSAAGHTKLTSLFMANAIDTDPFIKDTADFFLKPNTKRVNSDLDFEYEWKRLNPKKMGVLLGILFFIPQDQYRFLDLKDDEAFGLYESKKNDFIKYTKSNFLKQQMKSHTARKARKTQSGEDIVSQMEKVKKRG